MHCFEAILFCAYVSPHIKHVAGRCLLLCWMASVGTASIPEGWQTRACEARSGLPISSFLHFWTHH